MIALTEVDGGSLKRLLEKVRRKLVMVVAKNTEEVDTAKKGLSMYIVQ